jgi:hypothetical protein
MYVPKKSFVHLAQNLALLFVFGQCEILFLAKPKKQHLGGGGGAFPEM